MNYNELYNRALLIAIRAHQGQTDKAGRVYVTHPIRVADRCRSPKAKVVALLHDTIEDSDISPEELIRQGFPQEIVDAVLSVTRREEETYEEFVRRAAENPIGREVKMADLEDNMDIRRLHEITDHDVERLRRYLRSWQLLSQLGNHGDGEFDSE